MPFFIIGIKMARLFVSDVTDDGDYIIDNVPLSLMNHFLSIQFFTDSTMSTLVDKSTMTGTATVMGSEYGKEYGTMQNGTIVLGSSTYDRPNALGSYESFRVTLSGITGAAYFRLTLASL